MLDFPTNPPIGSTFDEWTWDGTKWTSAGGISSGGSGGAPGPYLPLAGGTMVGTLSGYTITMNPGGGNLIPAYPVGNSEPTASYTPATGILSQLVVQSQSTQATNPEWTGVFGNWSTAGQAAGAQKVALYAGAVQSPGSGPVWSLNTLVTRNAAPGANNTPGGPGNIGSGTPGTPGAIPTGTVTIGYELDWNNFDQDLPVGGGFGVGMWINMLGSYAATAAIYMSNVHDNTLLNYGWHDGILLSGAYLIKDNAINDATNATYSYQASGNRGTGSTFYAADTAANALQVGGNHTNADIWISDNAPTVLLVAGTHQHVIDVTGATISGTAWNGPLSATSVMGMKSGGGTTAAFMVQAPGNAGYAWDDTSGATDAKIYDALASNGELYFRLLSDSMASQNNWLTVTRSGYTPTQIALNATNIGLNGAVTAPTLVATTGAGVTGLISGTQWQQQGAWTAWNYAGAGMTNFINSHGTGAGGFSFYNVASSLSATPTLLATLDASGDLTASGVLTIGTGAATVNSGTGAPTATRPVGSLYMRTDGTAGARLYVSAGGGTWAAVAGV